mmetsp:Transcript_21061/g.81577  ORF Transcript_21061/g.81577 Transcript_21061/m.81577 type:complete len:639 (-) Transcript_21061:1062-2978(-)
MRRFVDQGEHQAVDDLLVADVARLGTDGLAVLLQQLVDDRRRDRIALAGLVVIPASAGLLAEAAQFAQAVGAGRVLHARLLDIAALANGPADVIAGQVAHSEGAHREAELLDGLVHLLRAATLVQQEAGLAAVLLDHAVADEAVADARDHGRLLDLLANRHDRGQHVLGRGLAAHHFQQLHHVGRAEEVHAHHVLRAAGERGNLVDVQRRGVGGQDRAGLGDGVELLEHRLLDADLLEHRLDDQVAVLEVVVAQRRAQQGHALGVLVFLQLALLDLGFVVLLDRGHATVEGFLLGLQDRDRQSGVQEIHRDAAAHGAGADDTDLGDAAQRRVLGHVGDLAGHALGEEQVAQGLGLGRQHQRGEALALGPHTLVELQVHRTGHGLQAAQRRRVVLAHPADHVAGELEVGLGVGVAGLQLAHLGQRALLGDFFGELDGSVHHIGVDDLVEQLLARNHRQHLGLDRLTADDHVQRRRHAQRARQALRAAGTGQQAQLHFRQRDLGARLRHAVMAAQAQLQATAHADAADGRDHRLAAVLDDADQAQQIGLGQRLGAAEFLDVGTAREGLAGTGDDEGRDGRIGFSALHAGRHGRAGRKPQAVDRRVVERDHGDGAANFVMGCHGHDLGWRAAPRLQQPAQK